MKIKLYLINLTILLLLIGCGDYRQRDSARRSVDSAANMGRRLEDMHRYNYDTYSKVDSFFEILDDFYNTTHYAKESLKYSTDAITQKKLKGIAAYFTMNDPYPNNKKDINYCEQVSNFFAKVIDLKNQNIPKNRVKLIIQNDESASRNLDKENIMYNDRLKIANITIDKIYNEIGKTDTNAAKNALKQGCLEVEFN
jgi:hypothetical protein